MPSLMAVRCEQCGSENSPQYHFCGMCGAPLPRPAAPPASTVRRPAAPVSGPSFLGLGDPAPRRDTSYLLEDEEEDSSRGPLIIIGILIVLVAAGCATWYVHTGKWPWQSFSPTQTASGQSAAPPSEPSATNSPVPVSPPQNPAATSSPPLNPTDDKRQTAPAPPQPPKSDQTSTPDSPADNADNTETDASGGKQTSSPVAAEAANEAPPPLPPAAGNNSPSPKSAAVKPVPPPTANSSPEDKLVSQGERYLYGNGVPQDCDRAQKEILTAARQENPKAYTLLGTMYATGHCATRDLPTAYRWYARALHQDPSNARLQQNLQVIWRQMTPGEKQIATRAQ